MDLKFGSGYLAVPSNIIENVRKSCGLDKPERREEAITILYDWIQKQDHLVKKDFSRSYLERMLVTSKGSVERAKKQIDKLCTMKTLMPKFFMKCNAKTELPLKSELAWVVPLPKLTEDNYRVSLIQFKPVKNFTSDTFLQYFQYHTILAEYIKANDYANGFVVIQDFRDVNILELVNKMNTVDLQQFMTILIEGYGASMKSINYLTDSTAIEILIKVLKPLISEKIRDRLHVQKNLEDLYKIVPKEILPVEYGGKERSILELSEELINEVSSENFVEYVKMMSKACSDETKRRVGKFNEEYLGMPGTFRCLSVD